MRPNEKEESYSLPADDFGRLTGITIEQEQHACFIICDQAETTEEAATLLNMLGVWPDKEYQELIRKG